MSEIERVAEGTISAFGSGSNFEQAQRMAKALASSSLVPSQYQGNVANCLVAMELAARIGVSVFAAMQNLDIIHGNPSWRAKFLIATVNASGRFSPIRYRFDGAQGSDSWGCRAVATDRETGDECVGPAVSIALAKAEGWFSKNGSKWKTIPELMLMYRAAAFWQRVYAPELSLGMSTSEEMEDVHSVRSVARAPSAAESLARVLSAPRPTLEVDQETGEVIDDEPPMREPGEEG